MASHLWNLNKIVWGILPGLVARVARACVNEVALYSSKVWRRPYKPQIGLLNILDKPLLQAARAVVLYYYTT